ncbi:thiol-disulfide oxidoreductase DCC family protein [Deinococcus misasensis]|uniref:thiol-disulfide oxidoreductase DCC family protein n=1 Tax=Deinococcus misasensis TaxID=392413 RepID=UPI00054D098B|nr:thiol-disulfide oxidoreductase DCC family protein [Deinococcus misasensis]
MQPEPIVLFDGVCNLCNNSVQFILLNERTQKLHFASLQSEVGQSLIAQHWKGANLPESVVLIEQDRIYVQSEAALRIAKHLKFPLSLLGLFVVVPRPIRDAVYDWIARNRYRWFGKQDHCMLPRPEWKSRFLG